MNIEHVEKSYQELESDSTLQNLIAQANARYILYNTEESKENFPDRKSTRLNSSHLKLSRMPSSA